MSDCQIFNESELKQCLEDDTINFHGPEPLPHDNQDIPFFLPGDDAFALRTYMIKPYSSRALTKEQAEEALQVAQKRHKGETHKHYHGGSRVAVVAEWRCSGCQSSFNARYWPPKGGTREVEALPRSTRNN